MSIAVLGDIVFEVSADKVRTWQELTRSGASRWAEHEVYAGKPVSEFLGPGNTQLHLSVRLDIDRGVVPRDELRKLRDARDTGAVLQFTVGGGLVGDFKIDDLNETYRDISPKGVLRIAIVGIALKEYH
jgi:phage protein U